MTYLEKILQLSNSLAHQDPLEGFEDFYMENVISMRKIVEAARSLDEENPSTAANSDQMKFLLDQAKELF